MEDLLGIPKEGIKFEHTIENKSIIMLSVAVVAVFLFITLIKKFS